MKKFYKDLKFTAQEIKVLKTLSIMVYSLFGGVAFLKVVEWVQKVDLQSLFQ